MAIEHLILIHMAAKHFSLHKDNPLSESDIIYLKEKARELNFDIKSIEDIHVFKKQIGYIAPKEIIVKTSGLEQVALSDDLNPLENSQSFKMISDIHKLLFHHKPSKKSKSYIEEFKAKIILGDVLKRK